MNARQHNVKSKIHFNDSKWDAETTLILGKWKMENALFLMQETIHFSNPP